MYLLPGRPRFRGYIPGGFEVYGGAVAQHHASFLSRIEREVDRRLVRPLRKLDPELARGSLHSFKLGQVKHFGALVPASQDEGLPLWDVSAGSPQQRQEARRAFASIAKKLVQRTCE